MPKHLFDIVEKSNRQLKAEMLELFARIASATGYVSNRTRAELKRAAAYCQIDEEKLMARVEQLEKEFPEPFPEVKKVIVAEEKGRMFEEYTIKYFAKNPRLTLKEWRGDKFLCEDKLFPESNMFPDLEYMLATDSDKTNGKLFGVECKWRSKVIEEDLVTICREDQFERYKLYGEQVPTFVALGVGGSPDAPEHFYVIPIGQISDASDEIKGVQISLSEMAHYECNPASFPFFNTRNNKIIFSKM